MDISGYNYVVVSPQLNQVENHNDYDDNDNDYNYNHNDSWNKSTIYVRFCLLEYKNDIPI